jgi:hypothetical protein
MVGTDMFGNHMITNEQGCGFLPDSTSLPWDLRQARPCEFCNLCYVLKLPGALDRCLVPGSGCAHLNLYDQLHASIKFCLYRSSSPHYIVLVLVLIKWIACPALTINKSRASVPKSTYAASNICNLRLWVHNSGKKDFKQTILFSQVNLYVQC